MQVWFKAERTAPTWTVSVDDAAMGGPGGSSLKGLPGITYQLRARRGRGPDDPFRIAVVERHASGAPGLDALKAELYPAPQRAVHRFDVENRLVTHTFYLDPAEAGAADSYEVRFTSREDAHSGAWQMVEPITVNVPEASDFLRLTPEAAASR